MKVQFIVPSYNIEKNIDTLVGSFHAQKNSNWECLIIDDMSTDNTWQKLESIRSDPKVRVRKNLKKKYALKNVVENATKIAEEKDCIIAILDGDDALCNENTVELILNEYKDDDVGTVWTAHKWDLKNLNISKEMLGNVDPYQWPWCSSHLRTFRSSLLKDISDENFKDWNGEWFKRGYDQALMLPFLYKTQKRFYLNEVCYQYNIESVSMTSSERIKADHSQISTVNFVRARCFMS